MRCSSRALSIRLPAVFAIMSAFWTHEQDSSVQASHLSDSTSSSESSSYEFISDTDSLDSPDSPIDFRLSDAFEDYNYPIRNEMSSFQDVSLAGADRGVKDGYMNKSYVKVKEYCTAKESKKNKPAKKVKISNKARLVDLSPKRRKAKKQHQMVTGLEKDQAYFAQESSAGAQSSPGPQPEAASKPPVLSTLMAETRFNPNQTARKFTVANFFNTIANNVPLPNNKISSKNVAIPSHDPSSDSDAVMVKTTRKSRQQDIKGDLLSKWRQDIIDTPVLERSTISLTDAQVRSLLKRTDLDRIGLPRNCPLPFDPPWWSKPPKSIMKTMRYVPTATFFDLPSYIHFEIFAYLAIVPAPYVITPYRYFADPVLAKLLACPVSSRPFLNPLLAFCAYPQVLDEYRAAIYKLNEFYFRQSMDLMFFAGALGGFPVQWMWLGEGGNVKVSKEFFQGTSDDECEWWVDNAWRFWLPSGSYAVLRSRSPSILSSSSSSAASSFSFSSFTSSRWQIREKGQTCRDSQVATNNNNPYLAPSPYPSSTALPGLSLSNVLDQTDPPSLITSPTSPVAEVSPGSPLTQTPPRPRRRPISQHQLAFEHFYLEHAAAGVPGYEEEIAKGLASAFLND